MPQYSGVVSLIMDYGGGQCVHLLRHAAAGPAVDTDGGPLRFGRRRHGWAVEHHGVFLRWVGPGHRGAVQSGVDGGGRQPVTS